MTDRIGIKLTELIAPILPFNLSEAEADTYPYAIYDYTPAPSYTKDGVYKLAAGVSIYIYSQDPDEAFAKSAAVREALSAGIDGDEFTAILRGETSTCSEGIWEVYLDYNINQYKQ